VAYPRQLRVRELAARGVVAERRLGGVGAGVGEDRQPVAEHDLPGPVDVQFANLGVGGELHQVERRVAVGRGLQGGVAGGDLPVAAAGVPAGGVQYACDPRAGVLTGPGGGAEGGEVDPGEDFETIGGGQGDFGV